MKIYILVIFSCVSTCIIAQNIAFTPIDSTQWQLIEQSSEGKFLQNDIFFDKKKKEKSLYGLLNKQGSTYIYLWASWCEECIEHIPQILEKIKTEKSKKVIFLSIDKDGNRWKRAADKINLTKNSFILPIKDNQLSSLSLQVITLEKSKTIITAVPVCCKVDSNKKIINRNLLIEGGTAAFFSELEQGK